MTEPYDPNKLTHPKLLSDKLRERLREPKTLNDLRALRLETGAATPVASVKITDQISPCCAQIPTYRDSRGFVDIWTCACGQIWTDNQLQDRKKAPIAFGNLGNVCCREHAPSEAMMFDAWSKLPERCGR